MTTPAEPSSVEDAARKELRCLWDDLREAKQSALDGNWSMKCDRIVHRIRRLTGHVGPTPWEQVFIGLLEDGTYQQVHADMGVAVDVDMVKVAETRASIEARMARYNRG